MMKHNIKSIVFKILDVLPRTIGDSLYHTFQNIKERKNFGLKIKSNEVTYITLNKILCELNLNLTNKTIIEIGSGWIPAMPYEFLYKGNASKIYTYDLNQHYQKKNIEKFNSEYFKNVTAKKFSTKYGADDRIIYKPKKNIIYEKLPKSDFIFSRFVLEHVTPSDLSKMHKKFYEEIDNDVRIIHFISPSDHRAFSDSSLSLQDFLQYSNNEWNKIQTRFDYHNRLRLPQYIEIFIKQGFEIEYLNYDNPDKNSNTFKKFKSISIDHQFVHMTDEELTAGSIIVVLKKNETI